MEECGYRIMAISKGKYEVKVKASVADNIGIPKVNNTNSSKIFSI